MTNLTRLRALADLGDLAAAQALASALARRGEDRCGDPCPRPPVTDHMAFLLARVAEAGWPPDRTAIHRRSVNEGSDIAALALLEEGPHRGVAWVRHQRPDESEPQYLATVYDPPDLMTDADRITNWSPHPNGGSCDAHVFRCRHHPVDPYLYPDTCTPWTHYP